jgi:hypothetical protein
MMLVCLDEKDIFHEGGSSIPRVAYVGKFSLRDENLVEEDRLMISSRCLKSCMSESVADLGNRRPDSVCHREAPIPAPRRSLSSHTSNVTSPSLHTPLFVACYTSMT